MSTTAADVKRAFDKAWDALADYVPDDTKLGLGDAHVLGALRAAVKQGIDDLASQQPTLELTDAMVAAFGNSFEIPLCDVVKSQLRQDWPAMVAARE